MGSVGFLQVMQMKEGFLEQLLSSDGGRQGLEEDVDGGRVHKASREVM